MGTEVEPSATVKELAADAKSYVAAIKAYREQSGLGLREARAVVDRLAAVPAAAEPLVPTMATRPQN